MEARELIYDHEGVEIFRNGSRYWLRYHDGGHMDKLREHEITEEEAERAQRGYQDFYWVAINAQNRDEKRQRQNGGFGE